MREIERRDFITPLTYPNCYEAADVECLTVLNTQPYSRKALRYEIQPHLVDRAQQAVKKRLASDLFSRMCSPLEPVWLAGILAELNTYATASGTE